MTTCDGLLSRNATKKHNDALAPNIESRFPSSLVDFYRLNVFCRREEICIHYEAVSADLKLK
jgi:hypothetical protein